MVLTRNIVYAAFALLVALLGVAGIFLLAFAEFLALVQVLIYGGAIVSVVLFALMLTRIEDFQHLSRQQTVASGCTGGHGRIQSPGRRHRGDQR